MHALAMVYSPSFCWDGNLSNAQVSNPFIDLKLRFRFYPPVVIKHGLLENSPKTWRCWWENHRTKLSIFQQTMFHYRRGTQTNGRHGPNFQCPNFQAWFNERKHGPWHDLDGPVGICLGVHDSSHPIRGWSSVFISPWIHSEANVYDDRSMLKTVISPEGTNDKEPTIGEGYDLTTINLFVGIQSTIRSVYTSSYVIYLTVRSMFDGDSSANHVWIVAAMMRSSNGWCLITSGYLTYPLVN